MSQKCTEEKKNPSLQLRWRYSPGLLARPRQSRCGSVTTAGLPPWLPKAVAITHRDLPREHASECFVLPMPPPPSLHNELRLLLQPQPEHRAAARFAALPTIKLSCNGPLREKSPSHRSAKKFEQKTVHRKLNQSKYCMKNSF